MSEYRRRRREINVEVLGDVTHGSDVGQSLLVTTVKYDKGEASILGGRRNVRGYYVTVGREVRLARGSHLIGLDGSTPSVSALLEPAPRFSEGKLEILSRSVDPNVIALCRQRVLDRYQQFLDAEERRRSSDQAVVR